jgi:hypothetical protein
MGDGQIFLKTFRASLFNDDLSNEPNFGRIHLVGQYLLALTHSFLNLWRIRNTVCVDSRCFQSAYFDSLFSGRWSDGIKVYKKIYVFLVCVGLWAVFRIREILIRIRAGTLDPYTGLRIKMPTKKIPP